VAQAVAAVAELPQQQAAQEHQGKATMAATVRTCLAVLVAVVVVVAQLAMLLSVVTLPLVVQVSRNTSRSRQALSLAVVARLVQEQGLVLVRLVVETVVLPLVLLAATQLPTQVQVAVAVAKADSTVATAALVLPMFAILPQVIRSRSQRQAEHQALLATTPCGHSLQRVLSPSHKERLWHISLN
jgi:hypothetical protein